MDSNSQFTITEDSPTADELIAIREAVGWRIPAKEAAEVSITNCLYSICVRRNSDLVGLGRVVGDGGLYYYVQDVIVLPEYQGNGLGAAIMDKIMAYLHTQARVGATIGLMAATGKEAFYEKYGFISRPNEWMGNGMCQFVMDE